MLFLLLSFALAGDIDPSQTTFISNPQPSYILDPTLTFSVQGRDSNGHNVDDSQHIVVDLYSQGKCVIGGGINTCEVVCYPYHAPHTAAHQCLSSEDRFVVGNNTAHWSPAQVTYTSNGVYDVSYQYHLELKTVYHVITYTARPGGLYGEYFDNIWFVGTPTKTQIDPQIDFHWGTDAITTYGLDYVSIRWWGKIKPPYSENFTFYIQGDDSVRIWVDKRVIAENWDACCHEVWGTVKLNKDSFHDIMVEYREIRDEASITLMWSSPSIQKQVVPPTYLYYCDHITGSPQLIYVGTGLAANYNTRVQNETEFAHNIAGLSNSVIVLAQDAFGNTLENDTADFAPSNYTATWQGDGLYELVWEKTLASIEPNFDIRLRNNDYPGQIVNSPFTLITRPNATYPPHAVLNGSGLSDAIAGETAYFDLRLFDFYSNEQDADIDDLDIRFVWSGGDLGGSGLCYYHAEGLGLYNCQYTLVTVGTYSTRFTINTLQAGTTDFTVTVNPGPAYGPKCTYTDFIANVSSGYDQWFLVQARDQFSNRVTIPDSSRFSVAVRNDAGDLVSHIWTAQGSGIFEVRYYPDVIGSWEITVQYDGLDITGSPFSVNVYPDHVWGNSSYVITSNGKTQATTVGEPSWFTIQTRDKHLNNLAFPFGSPFSDHYIECDGDYKNVNCDYLNDGIYNCSYTVVKAAPDCTMRLTIKNVDLIGSPWTVFSNYTVPDAERCYASGVADGIAGNAQAFTIHTFDTYDNIISTGWKHLSAEFVETDGTIVEATIMDNLDGTYDVAYETPNVNLAGGFVRAYLHAPGGLMATYFSDYFFDAVGPAGYERIDPVIDFNWGYDAPYAGFPLSDFFSVEWTGFISTDFSETYTLYADVSSNSGVRVFVDGEILLDAFEPEDGITEIYERRQFNQGQLVPITIQFREKTGNSSLSLSWSSFSTPKDIIPVTAFYYRKAIAINQMNQTQTVTILPNVTVASESILGAVDTEGLVAGQTIWFTLQARDAFGNNQTHAGNEESDFIATLTPQEGRTNETFQCFDLNTGADGRYQCSFTPYISTIHELHVLFKGNHISGSPIQFPVAPANASEITSSGVIYSGIAGVNYTGSMILKDVYDNLCNCSEDDVSISLKLVHTSGYEANIYAIEETGTGLGFFEFTYNGDIAGNYVPEFQINGNTVSTGVNINSSLTLVPTDANHSTTTIVPETVGNFVSGSSSNVTVQVRDRFGNDLIWQDGYDFYATLDDNDGVLYRASAIPQANGRYDVVFNVPDAGEYILDIKLASGVRNQPDGLLGHYFTNRWLYGEHTMTRVDQFIDFQWANGTITPTAYDYVSVRWSGFIKAPHAETHTFTVTSDDGCRLLINGTIVIDDFYSTSGEYEGSWTFDEADVLYPVVLEYRENTGEASIRFEVQSVQGYPTRTLVPTSVLHATANSISGSPITITVN